MFCRLREKVRVFLRSDDGATAIEYGLIVVGIAMGIALVIFTVGDTLLAFFAGLPALLAGPG